MIQIYSPGNTNFNKNGDMTLFPTICDAPSKLGGAWTLEITHPIDDEGRWKYIEKEAVLSVPTFMGENQLYRIDQITDKNDVDISAKAYPIFYDAADEVFIMDKRPTDKNGQAALNVLTDGTKYSGESDISAINTAYFVRRNLMDCLNGDSPSFATVWGGEPLYQNYKVIMNKRAGGDYGAEVRYGKNLVGVNVTEDMSEVVTRIVPVAYNGRILSSESVDSPLIKNYAKVYTKEIKFEDVRYFEDIDEGTDTEGMIICNSQEELDAALIEKCNAQFQAGIDLFKVTIKVDMVALENTEEYKDFKDLVRIGLGDDVSCYHTRLGIQTKARAVEIVWDCITDSVKNVILGDYQHNFLERWNSTMQKIEAALNEDGSIMAERVAGIIDGMNVQMKVQSTAAKKQDVRAILFEDLDPESAMYGALAIGTQGVQISKKRTEDGRAWDWTTAVTSNGILADAMITGLLADKTGRNFWNLDTGEFVLDGGSIVIKAKNFKLDEEGNVTVSGRYEVEHVRKIYAEDYTEADIDRMKQIVMGTIAPTQADLEKYDFKGTGVDAQCYVWVRRLLNGDDEWVSFRYRIVIDPTRSTSLITTKISWWSSSLSERVLGTSYFGGAGIRTPEILSDMVMSKTFRTYSEDNVEQYGTTGDFILADGTHIYVYNGIVTGIF